MPLSRFISNIYRVGVATFGGTLFSDSNYLLQLLVLLLYLRIGLVCVQYLLRDMCYEDVCVFKC